MIINSVINLIQMGNLFSYINCNCFHITDRTVIQIIKYQNMVLLQQFCQAAKIKFCMTLNKYSKVQFKSFPNTLSSEYKMSITKYVFLWSKVVLINLLNQ